MINIADVQPDAELKKMLDGRIVIHTSDTDTATLKVYQHDERPNTELPDDFIDIMINGIVSSLTHPLGVFKGSVAVSVYCRTNSNGSVKRYRVSEIISQLDGLIKYVKSGDFFFNLNPDNIITPTSINVNSGYSVTVLNVEWRMNESKVDDDSTENADMR